MSLLKIVDDSSPACFLSLVICMTLGRLERTIALTLSETTNSDSLLSGTFRECGFLSQQCPFTCATFFEKHLLLGTLLTASVLLCGLLVLPLK